MKNLKIKNLTISEQSKVFIVAEIGLNHNGDLNLAKQMIIKAKHAGADAVKFQVYKTDFFIHKGFALDQYNILKKYELNYKSFQELKIFSDKNNIIFFASPFDFQSVDFLIQIKSPILKIASGELSNKYFLHYCAKKNIPLFISTGLHTFPETKKIIKTVEKINNKLAIFYCLSEYPLKIESANLNALSLYQTAFDFPIGFSDHSKRNLLDIIAVTKGAKIIEKHFTINHNLPGPDHKISLDFNEFKELVQNIKLTENALGTSNRILTKAEKSIKKMAQKGIYAAVNIRKGEMITIDKLNLLRPVYKANSSEIDKFLNKKALKNYFINESL